MDKTDEKRIGQKFGLLTIIDVGDNERKHANCTDRSYKCKCDCGNEVFALWENLVNGGKKSCGCLSSEKGIADKTKYTGCRFGKLECINFHHSSQSKNRYDYYTFKCDCGNETVENITRVKLGNIIACKTCMKDIRTQRKAELAVGKTYGRLQVLEVGIKETKCVCSCGKEVIVANSALTNNMQKSCGCLRKEYAEDNSNNFIGERIGSLVCQGIAYKKGSAKYYSYKCDCGNTVNLSRYAVKNREDSGEEVNCGRCYATKILDKKYVGKLTAKKVWVRKRKGDICFVCDCKCGTEDAIIPFTYLDKAGDDSNCGCEQSEQNIQKTTEYLNTCNIDFKQNKLFTGLKGEELCFDFYVPSRGLLIDVMGKQHYEPVYFGKCDSQEQRLALGKEQHKQIKRIDKAKENFCNYEGFRLIRLHYEKFYEEDYKKILDKELGLC